MLISVSGWSAGIFFWTVCFFLVETETLLKEAQSSKNHSRKTASSFSTHQKAHLGNVDVSPSQWRNWLVVVEQLINQ